MKKFFQRLALETFVCEVLGNTFDTEESPEHIDLKMGINIKDKNSKVIY